MQTSDVLVPAHYYERMADLLIQTGLDLPSVVRQLDLPKSTAFRPGALIRFSLVDRLVTGCQALTGRDDLGFEFGRLLTTSSHSFVGFRMLHSETLDEALRFQNRYFRLMLPSFRMRYVNDGRHADMTFNPAVPMTHDCLVFHLEAIGMAALRELDDLAPAGRPACHLMHSIARPRHASRYGRLRDLRVSFASLTTPSVTLRITTDPCGVRLPTPDPHARELAEARCRDWVRRTTDHRGISQWVSMILREATDALPSLSDMAGMLNVSVRTLNRYLAQEGTTYRQLAGSIQHQVARNRLSDGAGISTVAFSLGFADVSTFARAFRAREGCSPTEFIGRGRGKRHFESNVRALVF